MVSIALDDAEIILAHPILWGVMALVAIAITLSGKLSVSGANVALVAAALLATVGVWIATARFDWLLRSLMVAGLALLFAAASVWLSRWIAHPQGGKEPSSPAAKPNQKTPEGTPPRSEVMDSLLSAHKAYTHHTKPTTEPTVSASSAPASAPTSAPVNAPFGIAIGGANFGNPQVVNNYGDIYVPPKFRWTFSQSEADMDVREVKRYGIQPYVTPGQPVHTFRATVELILESDFSPPAFRVTSDKRIKVSEASAPLDRGEMSYSLGESGSDESVDVVFTRPPRVAAGQRVSITVISIDGQISVLAVDPLRVR